MGRVGAKRRGGGRTHRETIKTADWIIGDPSALGLDPRVGPEGGGGEIVAQGTPEDVVKVKRSYTAAFLKPVLGREVPRGKKRVEAAD